MEIDWLGVGRGTGYGEAAHDYVEGLRAGGARIRWALASGEGADEPEGWLAQALGTPPDQLATGTLMVCAPPIWDERIERLGQNRRRVAYTTWETDRLPREWLSRLNRYDQVIVPSRFNLEVFRDSGVLVPIAVVPHIARPAFMQPRAVGSATPFTFLAMGVWSSRKAILDTVRAYTSAFNASDDVLLVIHTTARDMTAAGRGPGAGELNGSGATFETLARALAGRGRLPAIRLSTRELGQTEVEALHAHADCFISLSRAEGWGMPAFEAAARGRPVIVTGWGGSLDYLPDGYPYLVGYDLVPTMTELADDWWFPRPGERWARARIEHAATLMRELYEDREHARAVGERLRVHVAERFGAERIIPRLRELLSAPEGAARD